MNRRLTDQHIRSTCRELMAARPQALTGRQLRRTLRERYGAVGKTERVFRIWRELAIAESQLLGDPSTKTADMQSQLSEAEATAADAIARAEISEFRARADQDRWAQQIDDLRQKLQANPATQAQVRTLQDQLQRLSIELLGARAALARYEATNEYLNPPTNTTGERP